MDLHVATYNIHKGVSQFNRRMVLHELRDRLREVDADIVFLQEVIGRHERHANRFRDWPEGSQYEFLADSVWSEFAYGRNAVYDHGDHGNAILSRFPIVAAENLDVSSHPFESRGLLHCEVRVPATRITLHCVCVHFALYEHGRRQQLHALIERIVELVPDGAPLIVAGDFNDWRNLAGNRSPASSGSPRCSGITAAVRRGASRRGCRCSGSTGSMCAGSRSTTPTCTTGTRGRGSPTTRC
jgi:endonuclease/exonuclease/phosphatase family metal-dependent hydrolase